MSLGEKDVGWYSNIADKYAVLRLLRACFQAANNPETSFGSRSAPEFLITPDGIGVLAAITLALRRSIAVRFDVDSSFLRTDPMERLLVTEKMLSLGLITVEQAMEMEDLSPNGNEGMESA